jgi:hypothetical protein
MSNSILDTFKLDSSLFSAIAENIDTLQSTARTQALKVDKPVQFTGTINGVKVPAEVVLRSASLKRLSVLKHLSPNTSPNMAKKESLLVTGVMNPVQLDVFVTIDGVKMSLVDLFYSFVGNDVDRSQFETSLNSMGLKFNSEMPLFFQQFGASEQGIRHAIETFKQAGAVSVFENIDQEKRGRILGAYEHKNGVPMTSFELGTTDRKYSKTEQGFLNLVDAAVESFQRVYSLRLQAKVLEEKISDLPQAKVKEAEIQKDLLIKLSRQWASNWAGSQERIIVETNGTKTPQGIYDPVNAPCGRFSLVVNGSEVACDLWSNSVRSEQGNATSVVTKTESEEDPF